MVTRRAKWSARGRRLDFFVLFSSFHFHSRTLLRLFCTSSLSIDRIWFRKQKQALLGRSATFLLGCFLLWFFFHFLFFFHDRVGSIRAGSVSLEPGFSIKFRSNLSNFGICISCERPKLASVTFQVFFIIILSRFFFVTAYDETQ